MKILTAIANYGSKNAGYLDRLIGEYRSMDHDVDVVVLSNIDKELGREVEVKVGLPSKNPWSLPFGHKRIFAERINDYDLFIYSEDDTLIRQSNIDAFLDVSEVLPENEIAGFLRYEVDSENRRFFSSVHSHFHWVPGSVKSMGKDIFARFTNDHSACFMLMREQLQKAIDSGGFLVAPHQGRYDLLCTAATDPYTQCGFTKMICISRLEDFSLHHLPNQYLGRMGLAEDEMRLQVERLRSLIGDEGDKRELFATETKLNDCRWDKFYYEKRRDDILALVPDGAKNVLSVGCGWGETEAALVQKGVRVVAVPLDTVIGECARSRGVEAAERFDAILFVDVVEHLADPVEVLSEYATLLNDDGRLIVSVPNFDYIKTRQKISRNGQYAGAFEDRQLHLTTMNMVKDWLGQSKLKVGCRRYEINRRCQKLSRTTFGLFDRWLGAGIKVMGQRV